MNRTQDTNKPYYGAKKLVSIWILLALMLMGCDNSSEQTQEVKATINTTATLLKNYEWKQEKPLSVIDAAPLQMRAALHESYRLKPDKRFLLSVGLIHQFITGQPKANVLFNFENGQWSISYRNEMVGMLPDVPDFLDATSILVGWAKKLIKQYPLSLQGELPSDTPVYFGAPDIIKQLKVLDNDWAEGSRLKSSIQQSARLLIRLSLQNFDKLEIGDRLDAKALTMLMIADALAIPSLDRERCLLAYTMGYTSSAFALSKRLPADDGIRAFVQHDNISLRGIARLDSASTEERYLYLLRLAENRDTKGWQEWRREAFSKQYLSLPVAKTALVLNDFFANQLYAIQTPLLTVLNLMQDANLNGLEILFEEMGGQRTGWPELLLDESKNNTVEIVSQTILQLLSISSKSLVEHFDEGLNALSQKTTGQFLDAETYQAYYSSHFYSGLYVLGRHYLDRLSSEKATRAFNVMLGDSRQGVAGQFTKWYRALSDAKSGKSNVPRLLAYIQKINLGAPATIRLFTEFSNYVSYADPMIYTASKHLAIRLDTRPWHRNVLASLAYSKLYDSRLAEQMMTSALDFNAEQNPAQLGWYAYFKGDQKLLEEQLQGSSWRPKDKSVLINYLIKFDGIKSGFITLQYQKIITQAPDEWFIRSGYVKYLEQNKRYEDAMTVVSSWLSNHNETAGFDFIEAKVALARLLGHLNRYEEGLAEIAPVVKSYKNSAMQRAAILLEHTGRQKESEMVAQAAYQRYPDSLEAMLLLVEMYWRHAAFDKAAETIAKYRFNINQETWRFKIGKRFLEVFSDQENKNAQEAFDYLIAAKLSHFSLLQIASEAAMRGKPKMAFQMMSKLRYRGMGNLVFVVRAYKQLKKWQGEEVALQWLHKKIPESMKNASSMMFFRNKANDLLWNFITEPEQGDHADFVWLMRAASAIQQLDQANKEQLTKLYTHFAKAPGVIDRALMSQGDAYYFTIGRFLMGYSSEAKVLMLASDAKKKCEIAYYIGLKALGDMQLEDASEWFRISAETGQVRNGEYRWSHDVLYKIYGQGKNISRINIDDMLKAQGG